MATLAQDASVLIEELHCAPCPFLVLSMGGFIGLRLAARRPGLIRWLVLLETTADPEPGENIPKYKQLAFVARWIGPGNVANRGILIMFSEWFVTAPDRPTKRRVFDD